MLAQFVEQRLGVFQVRRVEALGEPVVDLGEHCASLVVATLLGEHPGKADGRAQLPPPGLLSARDVERLTKTTFCLTLFLPLGVSVLFEQQFSSYAVELGVEPAFAVPFGNY